MYAWWSMLDCTIQYCSSFFFDTPPATETSTLSLHDALPISPGRHLTSTPISLRSRHSTCSRPISSCGTKRSEEHTSELQSPDQLVCRLLLEKKKESSRSLICASCYAENWSVVGWWYCSIFII